MKSIAEIRQFISAQCHQPANLFSPVFFKLHTEVVEKYGMQLADVLGADKEVVQVAALIHDIACITDFSTLLKHAELGAELSFEILADYPLTSEQKTKVAHCICTHSQPLAIGADIAEAVCISNADAMSQIAQPLYWAYYMYNVRKFLFEEGFQWYQQRVDSHWNNLIEPAKKLIADKYELTKLFLGQNTTAETLHY